MPIYAYRCEACGHAKDVLQKISDPVLNVCPVCGADRFRKQLTAAGFQLKGSGWYATDFKGGAAPKAPEAKPADGAPAPASTPAAAPPAAAPPAGGESGGGKSGGGQSGGKSGGGGESGGKSGGGGESGGGSSGGGTAAAAGGSSFACH